MIGEDLDKSEDPVNGFHVKDNVVITLFAEFDPQYGYPLGYDRKQRCSSSAVEFAVLQVQPQPQTGTPASKYDKKE